MKSATFAVRNVKEIARDPLTVGFGLGFPLILLFMLSLIQKNVPVPMFQVETLTPGIAVFGLSFISLFSAMLISRDKETSFLMRLFASPMTSRDFILSYTLPLVPMAILQGAICFVAAFALGLEINVNVLMTLLVLIPTSLLYIAIGLLCGTLLTDKQVGGICGALLTNLSAWLSGIWFDVKLVGKAFETISNLLPFSHAVEAGRAALAGDYAGILPHLWWVLGYAVVLLAISILVFSRKMKQGKV